MRENGPLRSLSRIPLPMLHMAAQSSLVKCDRGTSLVMGTTATVERLDTMCFRISVVPIVSETGENSP